MEEKVGIVTGGSRGIGKAIVEKLTEAGYKVVLNYNNSEKEAKVLKEKNNNIEIFKADISLVENVESLVDFTISKYGRIDLVVNNAGIDIIKPIQDYSNEEFENIMRTNLHSCFYMCREVADYMVNQGGGSIINISSIWGQIGASCEVPYSISKAGLDGLTKSLAKELGPSNIRVNSIAPGFIDTDMNKEIPEDTVEDLKAGIPLQRIGTPDDVADCVLLLENCKYITGQVISVNGGWDM